MTDGYITNTLTSIAYNTHSVQWPFIAFVFVVLMIFIVVMCVCIFCSDSNEEEIGKEQKSGENNAEEENEEEPNKTIPTIYEHRADSLIRQSSIYIAVDDDGYGRSSITQLSHPTSSIVMSQRQSSSANVELVPGVPPTYLPKDVLPPGVYKVSKRAECFVLEMSDTTVPYIVRHDVVTTPPVILRAIDSAFVSVPLETPEHKRRIREDFNGSDMFDDN